ncbi:MAG: thioredoxin family protein [Promethearchaeota archaeon]
MTNIEELQEFGLNIPDTMKEGKVVLDVYTTWCGPCKFLSPILEKLEKEGLIKLLKEDLDRNRPLGERFGITAIPTLLFFNDGELLNQPIEIQGRVMVKNGLMVGAAGEAVMREIIEKM